MAKITDEKLIELLSELFTEYLETHNDTELALSFYRVEGLVAGLL